MTRRQAVKELELLQKAVATCTQPLGIVVAHDYHKDPYLLLISCLLSLRAKDSKTLVVVRELFKKVHTPEQLLKLPLAELERMIYSIGFYKQKAKTLRSVSADLIKRFNGQVPSNEEQLLSIKGVGRKTANLVLSMAYDIPAVCVDVHVHKIANLLGFVHTKTPEQTEQELRQLLPKKWWTGVNHVLVQLGQNIKKVLPNLPPSIQQRLTSLVSRKPVKH